MKPIVAFGHKRPVTRLAINRDGDLVVSASKDTTIALWNINTLECYGTMQHQGAILDVDIFNVTIVSASADFTLGIWYNGEMKKSLKCDQIVRSCQFSKDGQHILVLLEKYGKHDNQVLLINRDCEIKQKETLTSEFGKASICRWGPLNTSILVGFEDGSILVLDKNFKEINRIRDNENSITDIQLSIDQTMFITSSKDHTARLYSFDFKPLHVYKSDRPVNSASISSKREHVILGGGQEAMDVTTTAGQSGKFEARIFHRIYEKEIGRVPGHFSPINSIKFLPDGTGYISGAEEGSFRIHFFDDNYFYFKLHPEEQ